MKLIGWLITIVWFLYFIFPGLNIFNLPLTIAKNPWSGIGRLIGMVIILTISIRLIKYKKKEKKCHTNL